jgi:hypothetical protein
MKIKITLTLDAALLREAETLAAQRGTSISALLTAHLKQILGKRQTYDRAGERALARLREGMDLRWTPHRSRDQLHER